MFLLFIKIQLNKPEKYNVNDNDKKNNIFFSNV